jgi:hypothetical protein
VVPAWSTAVTTAVAGAVALVATAEEVVELAEEAEGDEAEADVTVAV